MMQRRALILAHALAWLSAAPGCIHSEAPKTQARPQADAEIRANVDKAVATSGDVITYTIEIDHTPSTEVTLPEQGGNMASLRIVDAGRDKPVMLDGRVIEKRWYKLRADLVGSYVLPPIEASYKGQDGNPPPTPLNTSEIFIEVKSVMPADGSATDIRDLKPLPVVHYTKRWPFVVGALALVAAGLAAVAYFWKRRRAASTAPQPKAHEVAFAALNALRKTDFADAQAVRQWYFDISEVLRAYVEARYHLNATDLTTEEIFSRLSLLTDLAPAERMRLQSFLADTDQVKFANHTPAQEEISTTYERALSFVEATQERPAPATPEDASASSPAAA
jgi:hypothetical protein